MAKSGHFALLLAFSLSSLAILANLLGHWRNNTKLIAGVRNATIGCFACLTVAVTILWIALVRSDFAVTYVAEHTSRALPLVFKLSALWAGAAGSLLLWLWMQTGFVVLVFHKCKDDEGAFSAGARGTANLVSAFFLLVLAFDQNPFAVSTAIRPDGAGLNPLLQHPAMALHAPILLISFAALAVPFAWAFASLKWDAAQGPAPLFRQARNWILPAWLFMTIGIVLRMWWGHEQLGPGGSRAWDSGQNFFLMPWLTATALLFCSRVSMRNPFSANLLFILSLVTYSLCILGTFLPRSALVSSVHAFPEPGLGKPFLILLIHIWILAAILLWRKCRRTKEQT
jgi:cytochrome c-type biogenesis protein CcmF